MYVGEHGHKHLSADILSNLVTQKEKEPLVYLPSRRASSWLILRQFVVIMYRKAREAWIMWLELGHYCDEQYSFNILKGRRSPSRKKKSSITAWEDDQPPPQAHGKDGCVKQEKES